MEPDIREEELPLLLEDETDEEIAVIHEGARTVNGGFYDYVGLTDIDSCAGLLVYDKESKKVFAAHLKQIQASKSFLGHKMKRFEYRNPSGKPEAYVVNGNSEYNLVVENTEQVLTEFDSLRFDINRVEAEPGTEGDICLERENGTLYDFRPSEETIREHQKRGPL